MRAIVDGGCGIVVAGIGLHASTHVDLAKRAHAVKRRRHQDVCVLVSLREHLVVQGSRNATCRGDLHDQDAAIGVRQSIRRRVQHEPAQAGIGVGRETGLTIDGKQGGQGQIGIHQRRIGVFRTEGAAGPVKPMVA